MENAPTAAPIECLVRLLAAAKDAHAVLVDPDCDANTVATQLALHNAIESSKAVLDLDGQITEDWAVRVGVSIMDTKRLCYRILKGLPFGLCPPCGELPACLTIGGQVIKHGCSKLDVLLLVQILRGGRLSIHS